MGQSKKLNLLRNLTLKVKPIKIWKYLPTYLPTYLVPPIHLNIDFNLFWPKFKNAMWHMSIMPSVTI
jgi:hypothetical protein